jgi:hypothetical protein
MAMATQPNYRATNLCVQLTATVVAACATLALLAVLRPGEPPDRTLRWAGVRSAPSAHQPGVPGHTLSRKVAAATPEGVLVAGHPTASTAR